jgi:hypothetical protein
MANSTEIIWTDQATGQKFIIDETGEKIFILADGSRVYESDLILEQMLEEFEKEEEERCRNEEAERLFEEEIMEEQLEAKEAEDDEDYEADDWFWNGVGMYTKEWYEDI